MSASAIAMAALLMLTAGALVGLVGSFLQGLSAEQNALGALAKRLAGDAEVIAWGRGYRIGDARHLVAFQPDVFTAGELRSGVVDVWRVQLGTRGLPRRTRLVLTNKPAVRGERVVDDVEGRPLERVGWRASDDGVAAGLLGPGPVARSLGVLLGRWRVRGLAIDAAGTLEIAAERDTATQHELSSLLDDVRAVAASIDQLTPQLPPPDEEDDGLVSLGPSSGEPVPVRARASARAPRTER